jgi:tetratricopeptide (TPR) repeat protein
VAELEVAIDIAARERGYKDAHEFEAYLQANKKPEREEVTQKEFGHEDMPEMPTPGVAKAPAYMPPGAYPGDRTKLAKDYAERTKYREEAGVSKPLPPAGSKPGADGVVKKFVRQVDDIRAPSRPSEGQSITFRTVDGGEEQQEDIASPDLPWALDTVVRNMKVGDVMEVVAHGEHAFADSEKVDPDAERRWPYFELLAISGSGKTKFSMKTDERIHLANAFRLRGNDMFKVGRHLRAMDYYERGSSLMDVLEADSLGMPNGWTDKQAEASNKRIWACQKLLLLNWALILMKYERWEDAERKLTEVLMDVDKLNVKALFRRGVCNFHLGRQDQARTDLDRAAEMNTGLRGVVDWWLVKVEALQRQVDKQHVPFAKKVVQDLEGARDSRSENPPQEGTPTPTPQDRMMMELMGQEAENDESEDLDLFCAQRSAIYNKFMVRPSATEE